MVRRSPRRTTRRGSPGPRGAPRCTSSGPRRGAGGGAGRAGGAGGDGEGGEGRGAGVVRGVWVAMRKAVRRVRRSHAENTEMAKKKQKLDALESLDRIIGDDAKLRAMVEEAEL